MESSGFHRYPFVDVPFEVKVFLIDGDKLKCGDEIPLSVKLIYDQNEETELAPDLYVIEGGAPLLGRNGMTVVTIRIKEMSMSLENKSFVAVFSPVHTHNSPKYLKFVDPVRSISMLCVRDRISLKTEMKDIWYKDEGGKDNRMDLTVQLVTADGSLNVTRKVPLKVTLTYENGTAVLKQNVISLSSESDILLTEGIIGGSCLLKVRINDVSKNHQRQRFRILVTPDTGQDPLLHDVGADATQAIEVKSKRSKRLRDDGTGVAGTGSLLNPRSSHADASVPIAPFPFTQLNTKESRNEYNENGILDQENGINNNGKMGVLHGSHSHLKSGTSHDAKRITNQLILDALSPPLPVPFCPPVALRQDLELLDSVPESIEGGADALLQWISTLVSSLQSFRWTVIGYHRKSDGEFDTRMPIHTMANPNERINALLLEHSGHRISKSISLVENMIRNSHEFNNTTHTNKISKEYDKPIVENGEIRFSNNRKNGGLKNGVSHFNDSHFRNIRDEYQINNNSINNTNTPSLRQGSESVVRNSNEEFDHYDKSIKRKKIGNISEEIVTMKNLADKNNNNINNNNHNNSHNNDNNHSNHNNHNNHTNNHTNTIHNNSHSNNINHNDNDYSNNLFSDINGNKNNVNKHNHNNINNTDHNHNNHNNHNHNNNHVFNKHFATKQVAENHQNINHGQNNQYSVLTVKENRDILNQRINNRDEANYDFVGSYNNNNNSGSSSSSSSNSSVSNSIISNSNVNSLHNNGNIIANRLGVNNVNNKFNNNNNNININNNNINNGNNNNMIHRNNNVNNILRGSIIDNNINQNNNNVNHNNVNNVNNMYTNRPDNTPTTTQPYTVLPFTTSSSSTSSATTTSFSTSSTTTTITTEADIYYVIAEQKPIKAVRSIHTSTTTDNTTSGIPAFDQFKNLIGFYEECIGMNNTTTISFLPLTSLVMDEREIRSLRILLDLLIDGAKKDEAKQGRSGSGDYNDFSDPFSPTPSSPLYSLTRCGQIDRLKQEAMMHCWMVEMAMFDLAGDEQSGQGFP